MSKASTIMGSGLKLGALTVALVGLAIGFYVHNARSRADAAEAAYWSLTGPACAPLDKAAYDATAGKVQAAAYGGVRFEYRAGHMMCVHRPDDRGDGEHPVCQFTGPGLLGVKTGQTSAYFATGSVGAARAAVIDGTVRCVRVRSFQMKDRK